MDSFLKRISSRKFLMAAGVAIVGVVAFFSPPQSQEKWAVFAEKSVELLIVILAGMGYAKIEGDVDKARAANGG